MEDERIFTKFFLSLKRKWLVVLVAALGVGLVLLGGSMTEKHTATSTAPTADEFETAYRKDMEESITAMCKKIDGAGDVSVMITLSSGNAYTYSGGKLVAHQLPTVAGVAVICDGGSNERVKGEITRMIAALLDIGTHRIYVGKSK